MTPSVRDRLRGCTAVVLTLLMVGLPVPLAHAAAPAGPPASNASSTPAAETPADAPPAVDPTVTDTDTAAAQPVAPVPQLQLQDEGPAAADAQPVARARSQAVVEGEERPFWKSWIFWTITGALVVGAVGLAAYTSSEVNPSLAPCPPDVQVSLGCFGAGRAR